MNITIYPKKLSGSVTVIPSKSQAHRLLICAAFSDNSTTLICRETNRDMDATADCLRALGAQITKTRDGYSIHPIQNVPHQAVLNCGESGSTLRFLLPIAGALGVDAAFHMEGRLPKRPLSPLWEEMERMGCTLSRPTQNTIRCAGKLHAGDFRIDESVSSQFITGLLFALSLIPGQSSLETTGKIESRPYIDLTKQAMAHFGAPDYHSPGIVTVEGDWSNGAFWLAANKLGSSLSISGLSETSVQGDRAVADILSGIDAQSSIDCADIPDLVPILAVTAAANRGAVFQNISRLRLKESDRVASVASMIRGLGGSIDTDKNSMTVYPSTFSSGIVDAAGDHRIAMAAAIAATCAAGPVTIQGAEAVNKSYPNFWAEYRRLGGNYEQHLR